MTSVSRTPLTRSSPMLHTCTTEGCTTIVFGRGPCVEHEPRRVELSEQLLAEAVAAAQLGEVRAETSGSAWEE